jgi:galacturan 1,4-alpha-galacturonidase
MYASILAALCVPALAVARTVVTVSERVCIVEPCANGGDSAPAIIEAFEKCGHNEEPSRGKVVFRNETYNIHSVMNTTGLKNVDVDLNGLLLWDTNIPYWLNHSLPVGYQNQSSAWLFGGENINWDGHGYATLNGSGQTWYTFVNGTNN